MDYWKTRKVESARKQLIEGLFTKSPRKSQNADRAQSKDKISCFNRDKSLKKRRFSQRKIKQQVIGQGKVGSARRFNDNGWEKQSKIGFEDINKILEKKEAPNRESDMVQEIFTKNYMAMDLIKMNGKLSVNTSKSFNRKSIYKKDF